MLVQWPRQAYARGATHAKALIIGHTTKDGTASFYGTAPLANATEAEWAAAMKVRWGADAARVMARYSLRRFGNLSHGVPAATASYIEADADERLACPSRELALLAAARAPVYTYTFAHLSLKCDAGWTTRTLPWWLPRATLAGSGWASHGAENKYVFGTHHGPDDLALPPLPRVDCPSTAAEDRLIADVGRIWSGFATPSAAPPWALFSPAEGAPTSTMRIDDAVGGGDRVLRDFKADDCAWWAAHPAAPTR